MAALPPGVAPVSVPLPGRGQSGPTPGLLVSVRSAEEVPAALAGGADVIDVKEPARGSLGRADEAVVNGVLSLVAGRRVVSAAQGELRAVRQLPPLPPRLAYAKWGLAGMKGGGTSLPPWDQALDQLRAALALSAPACQLVAVGYADWDRANAPTPEEVCDYAQVRAVGAFLVDTWEKDGSGLLDWMSVEDVRRLIRACRQGGVRVALAGSLGRREIATLRGLEPDWFAVRGAACAAGRASAIDEGKVRSLAALLR